MSLRIENREEHVEKKGIGEIGYGVVERWKLGIIEPDLGTYIQILRVPITSLVSWPYPSKDWDAFPL